MAKGGIGKLTAPVIQTSGESSARISTTYTTPLKRGVARGGSGSAFSLPKLVNIQWEKRTDRPGFACWHTPEGANAPRRTKTYLGYVSRALLTDWEELPDDQRRTVVERWVSERRKEKGIG